MGPVTPRPRPALPTGVAGFSIDGRRLGGAEVWQTEGMRSALAQRDVAGVYRCLQAAGVSQRRIAAATGQSQSEIPEILKGRRVKSAEVLERIADGLGVPRGAMGLAHSDPPSLHADVASAASAVVTACTKLLSLLSTAGIDVP